MPKEGFQCAVPQKDIQLCWGSHSAFSESADVAEINLNE